MSQQLSDPGASGMLLETFLEEVALVPATEVNSSRLGLRLSPEDMAEFEDRLQTLLDEFAGRPDDPTARPWSLFLALHPDVLRSRATADPAAVTTRRDARAPGRRTGSGRRG